MQNTIERVAAIAPDFSERYQISIASTDELRRKVYRLRHKVFCDELGYAMDHIRGHEFDEYDAGSLHILLRERASGTAIGCFRLVLPQEGEIWLPFDEYGVQHVDSKLFDWSTVNRPRSVEVSRLALNVAARHVGSHDKGAGASDPYLATAMFYAVTALVMHYSIDNVFMVIEPRLGRLISRYGFRLSQISPPFEYYGQRATFTTSRRQGKVELVQLKKPWRNLFDVINKQLFSDGAQPAKPRKLVAPPLPLAAVSQPRTVDMVL
ncbi:MAG TPA: PEP-CTERM/exosortase system-associated acyltransferase [Spongiibacteraceae bacterium]|nr:PEP-CTERM/exosortase system-associated acyltransferase [Spongiibacteraceae bacterium]